MPKKIYDCIVIGAGIAGLMAARELDKSHIDFICIDRKHELGYPLKCGEGVCKKTFDRFFPDGNSPFIRNTVTKNRFIIFAGGKKSERTIHFPYYQLDRPEFEKWLGKGLLGKIRLGDGCEDVIRTGGLIQVRAKSGTYYAKSAILSCGCNYTIQKKFGMANKALAIATLYSGIFKDATLKEDEFLFSYSDRFFGGFWAFPKKNGLVNAGIGALHNTGLNLKAEFKQFTRNLKGLENIVPVTEFGAIEPVSGPIHKTYTDSVLAAGDAAGQVFAFSGEGIKYAMVSGCLAGRVISEAAKENDFSANFLSSYEKRWNREIGDELKAGLVLKEIAEYFYKRHPSHINGLFMWPSEKELLECKAGIMPLKAKLLYGLIKRHAQKD